MKHRGKIIVGFKTGWYEINKVKDIPIEELERLRQKDSEYNRLCTSLKKD